MRLRMPKLSWRRLTRLPMALEIALAVLLKVLILTLLWKAFFAAPQTKKMRLPTPQVEQHLLNAARPTVAPHSAFASTTISPSTPSEVSHASR